ncbi:MAG: BrnA antitoxin family protein [Oligoflexia bacterium]|nr:BrnA antitoxin family protein [Oligoflexia bacterium]
MNHKKAKQAISIRIDERVLEWFRQQQPKGYQTFINAVLEQYVARESQHKIRLAGRAQELFRRFYAQCFWHYKQDLEINPQNMHLVVDGLKKYAGREGVKLAEELCR